jgi:hypothetical protein
MAAVNPGIGQHKVGILAPQNGAKSVRERSFPQQLTGICILDLG